MVSPRVALGLNEGASTPSVVDSPEAAAAVLAGSTGGQLADPSARRGVASGPSPSSGAARIEVAGRLVPTGRRQLVVAARDQAAVPDGDRRAVRPDRLERQVAGRLEVEREVRR